MYNAGMQYTLRNISKPVDKALRAKAKTEGKSLNMLAVELIERGLGLNGQSQVHHDLDDLFGSGKLDAKVIKALAEQDVINLEDWK